MNYWFIKSDPLTYGWSELVRDEGTVWDGVNNPQALKSLRSMTKGDLIFFYHSTVGKEIIGIATVHQPAPSDFPFIKPVRKFTSPVSLSSLKQCSELRDVAFIRQPRLSVCKLEPAQWQKILELAGESSVNK